MSENNVVDLQTGENPALTLPTTEEGFRQLWEGLGTMERNVLPPRKFRVVLFGSARITKADPIYAKYKMLGFEIGRRRIGGVTGGGPGLMEAFNEGILEGWASIGEAAYSHGVCIQQINRDEPPNGFLRQAYYHKLVLTRLHQFARLGYWGVILLAEMAGYGSDLEKALMHQLLQFQQLQVPLIGIGPMWKERKAWEHKWIIDRDLADPHDADYMKCVDEAMDALPIIVETHARYKAIKAAG